VNKGLDLADLMVIEQGVRPMCNVVFVTEPSAHDTAKLVEFRFEDEMGVLLSRLTNEFVFALFATEDGRYVYSKGWGWRFFPFLERIKTNVEYLMGGVCNG
jgi:hypothetical protein